MWLVAGRLFGVSLGECELLDLSEVGSSIAGQGGLQAVVDFPQMVQLFATIALRKASRQFLRLRLVRDV